MAFAPEGHQSTCLSSAPLSFLTALPHPSLPFPLSLSSLFTPFAFIFRSLLSHPLSFFPIFSRLFLVPSCFRELISPRVLLLSSLLTSFSSPPPPSLPPLSSPTHISQHPGFHHVLLLSSSLCLFLQISHNPQVIPLVIVTFKPLSNSLYPLCPPPPSLPPHISTRPHSTHVASPVFVSFFKISHLSLWRLFSLVFALVRRGANVCARSM